MTKRQKGKIPGYVGNTLTYVPSMRERISNQFKNCVSIQISHVVIVVALCITATIITDAVGEWKRTDVEIRTKQITSDKEERVEIAVAEARKQEAIAAQNPYAAAAQARKEQRTHITINGYTVGNPNNIGEINLQPIKVNGNKYNHQQRKLLTLAFHIGEEIGFPETVQSILLQETIAGKLGNRIGDTRLPMGKRSYGVMQVKVGAARQVLRTNSEFRKHYFPEFNSEKKIRDEEIIILMIQDDIFNIKVGALYFAHQKKKTKDWTRAVVSYNQGLRGARKVINPKKHKYYRQLIQRLIKEVRPFNKRVGLLPSQ